MATPIAQFLGLLCLLLGSAFSILGILGFLRLPDVYTRLHASGKVSNFGVAFLVAAAVFLTPLSAAKGLILIGLVLLAAPTVAHAIASAAYRSGLPPRPSYRDDLAKRRPPPSPPEN